MTERTSCAYLCGQKVREQTNTRILIKFLTQGSKISVGSVNFSKGVIQLVHIKIFCYITTKTASKNICGCLHMSNSVAHLLIENNCIDRFKYYDYSRKQQNDQRNQQCFPVLRVPHPLDLLLRRYWTQSV